MAEDSPLTQKFGRLLRSSFDQEGYDGLAKLDPVERVLVYYLYRGAAAGYRVSLFQMCPFPHLLDEIHNLVKKNSQLEDKEYLSQLTSWWVYLYSNQGVHCQRETENNKKAPADMDLNLITKESLEALGLKLEDDEWRYLFDKSYFPTATVPEDIEKSGLAFYPRGYKKETYAKLSQEQKDCLVAYHTDEGMKTYSSQGVCAKELGEVVKWLKLALEWSKNHTDIICKDVPESLEPLIRHFESGDEEDFKDHSRVWLKMKSKVEFCFGFIEYYDDPMFHIGTFQADVTVKSHDISPLLAKLPSFEERFPFPQEFKRIDMTSIPNAAPANKVIGMGGLGPVFSTLAYCLPNYQEMRSNIGSKQVMYPAPAPSDAGRYVAIYFGESDRKIFEQYSPDLALERACSSLCTTLHETIGHASGNMIEGVTEKVRNERLGKWGNGLEEMRAEILALYSIYKFYDEIAATGFLGDWPEKVPKSAILRCALDDIAGGGWRRWRGLPSGSTAISQAHALADTGIMYYLLDHCPEELSLVKEEVTLPGEEPLKVMRLKVRDELAVFPVIEELAQKVQEMSSTADAKVVNEFMEKYAASTRDGSFGDIVTGMRDAISHGVIHTVFVFPEFEVVEEGGKVVDAKPVLPADAVAHFQNIFEMSKPQ